MRARPGARRRACGTIVCADQPPSGSACAAAPTAYCRECAAACCLERVKSRVVERRAAPRRAGAPASAKRHARRPRGKRVYEKSRLSPPDRRPPRPGPSGPAPGTAPSRSANAPPLAHTSQSLSPGEVGGTRIARFLSENERLSMLERGTSTRTVLYTETRGPVNEGSRVIALPLAAGTDYCSGTVK